VGEGFGAGGFVALGVVCEAVEGEGEDEAVGGGADEEEVLEGGFFGVQDCGDFEAGGLLGPEGVGFGVPAVWVEVLGSWTRRGNWCWGLGTFDERMSQFLLFVSRVVCARWVRPFRLGRVRCTSGHDSCGFKHYVFDQDEIHRLKGPSFRVKVLSAS